jgi:hypothetical protein
MPMRLIVLLSSVLLIAVAAAQATTGRGTLTGVVMRGPITPVCVAEQPCDAPAKGVMLLFSRNDRILGRVVTDGEGRYRLRLAPGMYTVRRAAAGSGLDRKLDPNHVRVYGGRASRVDFFIDTGIR